MLSKVIRPEDVEVVHIEWRTGAAPGRRPLSPAGAGPGAADAETAALKARLAEAASAAERRIREAYNEGLREGDIAGRRGAQAQVDQAVERLAATIDDVAGMRAGIVRRAESDIVRLAIEIARRVLHRELSVDTSALEGLIKAAIAKLQMQEICRVKIHPDQERILRSCLEQMGRGTEVEVVQDLSQPKGGAVFEITRGCLDASVEAQLREIERGLADQLQERP